MLHLILHLHTKLAIFVKKNLEKNAQEGEKSPSSPHPFAVRLQ